MLLKTRLVSGIAGLCLSFGALASSNPKAPPPQPARAFYACVYQLSDPDKVCLPIDIKGVNKNADSSMSPASLNKMMTAHLLLNHMAEKGHKLDDPFTYVSREDAAIGRLGERNGKPITDGRTLRYRAGNDLLAGIPEDHVFTYREFISAMLVFSANDFTAATARIIAPDGKQETFARMMTAEARSIGMEDTIFKTASGMPATGQRTTAEDMSRLVHHLVKTYGSTEFNTMFGQSSTVIAGRNVPGHLRLLDNGVVQTAKSGLDRSGSNIAGSAERGGYGIAFSTMGSPNGRTRDTFTSNMLSRIFSSLIPSAEAKTEAQPEAKAPPKAKPAPKKTPPKKVQRATPKKQSSAPKN